MQTAHLQYNELSLEDGFDQFDLDNDGRHATVKELV